MDRDLQIGLSESLTRISNLLIDEETLQTVLDLVVSLADRTMPAADGVGVTLSREGRLTTAACSNEMVLLVDREQYAAGDGPCISALDDRQVNHVEDLRSDDRWPAFASMALGHGVRSVLAVPLMPAGVSIGALNMYSRIPFGFDEGQMETGSLFADHVGIVLANSHAYNSAEMLNGQLTQALESRDLIGQAKGIVMERERCTADQAFELLVGVSQRSNMKLREVAEELVASVELRGAPG